MRQSFSPLNSHPLHSGWPILLSPFSMRLSFSPLNSHPLRKVCTSQPQPSLPHIHSPQLIIHAGPNCSGACSQFDCHIVVRRKFSRFSLVLRVEFSIGEIDRKDLGSRESYNSCEMSVPNNNFSHSTCRLRRIKTIQFGVQSPDLLVRFLFFS